MHISEFSENEKFAALFAKHNLHMSRMISGSKSGYHRMYPDNEVVFNANIIIESAGKVWHGDLDVTRDEDDLKAVSNELGETLYVLGEMDARFGNEDNPIKELMKIARYKID